MQQECGVDESSEEADARRAPVFRVLDLLRFIATTAHPVTVAEIATELSLPRGTVHRLCVRLEHEGWLEREPDGRHFTVGAQAETMATRVHQHSSRRATRHAILEALSARKRKTIRHLHRILVLRRKGDAAQGGKTKNCDRWDRDARHNTLHTLSARC